MNALLALFIRSLRELLRSTLSYWMLSGTIGLNFLFLLGASASDERSSMPDGRSFFSGKHARAPKGQPEISPGCQPGVPHAAVHAPRTGRGKSLLA